MHQRRRRRSVWPVVTSSSVHPRLVQQEAWQSIRGQVELSARHFDKPSTCQGTATTRSRLLLDGQSSECGQVLDRFFER